MSSNVQYAVTFDGSISRLADLQEGVASKINKLGKLADERPDWMKRTDFLNAEREARVEELKHSRPDLYELRASYIRRYN